MPRLSADQWETVRAEREAKGNIGTRAADVRRELGWLKAHGLVTIDERGPVWSAELAAYGMDVYEYRADAPAGLARPPRW